MFGQLLITSIALVWVWVAGIRFLWRSDRPMSQALVWAYGLLCVLFAVTAGAKIYYLAAAYVYLLAAGAVRLEGWWSTHRVRSGLVVAGTALYTALVLPVVLPILPARDIGGLLAINAPLGEEVGWPELVHSVARVWNSLPAAINELGRGTGLPIAVSGHNNEWLWGLGNPAPTTVVAVAPGPVDTTNHDEEAYLSRFFALVRIAATLSNSAGLHNQEWGGHVYICTGLRRPWARMWPQLRQYS